ncbi:TPA: GPO family capsid scaffolding protein, partial [Klebsiella pneumoniae]|nr:GPO family capsid scaffolding protein [Klebsiella pneumoniae]
NAFATLKKDVTTKADQTSQAFSQLKTSLDKTESTTQPRRKLSTGGGGDELLTDC